ncbi:ATP-binding protein [Streptomyces sp. NPDC093250]|uniref:ATP-binding protein n=1 Tax=Streptomyces sp. NPDC093250 TaxID=3366036 RepID=UPI00381EFFF9
MPTDSGPTRLRLLTVAVDDYGDPDDGLSLGVKDQLRAVHAWWTDPALGERGFTGEYAAPLHTRHDIDAFLHASDLREAPPEHALVLYITGHGLPGSSGHHFLQLPATDPQRLQATAYRTSDLVLAALDSHAGDVLVVVNTCHSARIDAELAAAARDIALRRRRGARLAVIATADAAETVAVRDMAILLDRAREQLRTTAGITAEHLSVEEFLAELDRAAHRHGDQPLTTPMSLLTAWGGPGQRTRCLPNPGYTPPDTLIAPARRQVAATRSEIDYWLSRASGRTHDTDPGWYFSGRTDVNRRLAGFLTNPGPGALIVTGTAGSGKSAVIARAVTLTDPAFRTHPHYRTALTAAPEDTLPPPGSIHAAVLARNKSADLILADLITALGHPPATATGPETTETLRTQLHQILTTSSAGPGRPVTLVIDGFDEATTPYALIPQLIAPLAPRTAPTANPGIRLIIGVRSTNTPPDGDPGHTFPAPGGSLLHLLTTTFDTFAAPTVIRTDTPEETLHSITAYLRALLTGTASIDEENCAEIAARTTPSFLDARIAAGQLRTAPDPAALARDPQWHYLLQQGTIGLLRQDLTDTDSPDLPAATALAILRAAAFAPGAGIPWADIWPAVTQAVLGHDITDPDAAITNLMNSRLAGYLTQDIEDGRTVHRPLHERLTEVLRDQPHQLRPPSPTQSPPGEPI